MCMNPNRYDPTKDPTNPWFIPLHRRLYNATPAWVFLVLALIIGVGGQWLVLYLANKQ